MALEYLKINIYNTRNELLVSSTQCSVNEEEDTLVISTEKTDLFDKYQFVRVELLTDKGVQQAEGFIRLIVDYVQVSITLAKFDSEVEERREFVKVPCEFHQELHEVLVDGTEVYFDEPVPIVIRNISLGGMLFAAPVLFELGTQGQIVFTEGEKSNHLFFNIVRVEDYSLPEKERPAEEIYDYRYGCQFEKLSNEAETAVCRYVLREDALRRKRKENQYWEE